MEKGRWTGVSEKRSGRMGSMMLERLLDSVILIDRKTAVSVITRAEILVGIEESDEKLVKAFLDQYRLLVIDRAVADLAADLRRTYHWKLPDAFQAAICMNNNIKLTTRNTKDFDPSKHNFIEIPYTL